MKILSRKAFRFKNPDVRILEQVEDGVVSKVNQPDFAKAYFDTVPGEIQTAPDWIQNDPMWVWAVSDGDLMEVTVNPQVAKAQLDRKQEKKLENRSGVPTVQQVQTQQDELDRQMLVAGGRAKTASEVGERADQEQEAGHRHLGVSAAHSDDSERVTSPTDARSGGSSKAERKAERARERAAREKEK